MKAPAGWVGFTESNEVLFVPIFPLPLDQTLFRFALNLILKALTKKAEDLPRVLYFHS